jgi:hypothetical protein
VNPNNNLPFGLDYIYAVEGLNEPEHFMVYGCRDTLPVKQFYQQKWDEITYRTQKGIFNKVIGQNNYSHLKVLAPSIWEFYRGAIDSLLAQGPIENYFYAGNLHLYPDVVPNAFYSWDNLKFHPTFFVPLYLQKFYNGISNYGNNKPKYVTETGYLSQSASYDTTYEDINEIAAAKYISFLPLEFFKNGIEKVIFYKLFENNSGIKDRLGFIKRDYSIKPMFNTLKNITKILSDTANINQSINILQFTTNYFSPTLRTMAYQLKNDELVLAVWRGDQGSACYDFQSNSLINVNPININFSFNQNNINKIYVYDPVYSISPIDSTNNNSVSVNLTDRLLLIKLKLEGTTSVTLDQNVNTKVYILPNPASNRLIVEGINENDFEIIIYTLNGEELKKLSNQKNIDISDLANGLYFIRIKTPKQIINHKVLVMK